MSKYSESRQWSNVLFHMSKPIHLNEVTSLHKLLFLKLCKLVTITSSATLTYPQLTDAYDISLLNNSCSYSNITHIL